MIKISLTQEKFKEKWAILKNVHTYLPEKTEWMKY